MEQRRTEQMSELSDLKLVVVVMVQWWGLKSCFMRHVGHLRATAETVWKSSFFSLDEYNFKYAMPANDYFASTYDASDL